MFGNVMTINSWCRQHCWFDYLFTFRISSKKLIFHYRWCIHYNQSWQIHQIGLTWFHQIQRVLERNLVSWLWINILNAVYKNVRCPNCCKLTKGLYSYLHHYMKQRNTDLLWRQYNFSLTFKFYTYMIKTVEFY